MECISRDVCGRIYGGTKKEKKKKIGKIGTSFRERERFARLRFTLVVPVEILTVLYTEMYVQAIGRYKSRVRYGGISVISGEYTDSVFVLYELRNRARYLFLKTYYSAEGRMLIRRNALVAERNGA